MRLFQASCVLLVTVALSQTEAPVRSFEDFIAKYQKVYTQEESKVRREAFEQNLRVIEAENAKGHLYTLGINEFSDLSSAEFKASYGCSIAKGSFAHSAASMGYFQPDLMSLSSSLPSSFDWRSRHMVTAVKNQGQCGSCWAFSAVAAAESSYAIQGNGLKSFSEQQVIDCSSNQRWGNHGCNGGAFQGAFGWMTSSGLFYEAHYAYRAAQGHCKPGSDTHHPIVAGSGYWSVQQDNDGALQQAVLGRPVSVAIEADQTVFQHYRSGVITSECGDRIDHAVLIIGYGTEHGIKYWLVKNSWGTSWGEAGFVKIQRGVSGNGQCGINSDGAFPNVPVRSSLVVV